MIILVFIIFIGIVSVVFYLFLRGLFEDNSCNVPDLQGKETITPLLPKEETLEDKAQSKKVSLRKSFPRRKNSPL